VNTSKLSAAARISFLMVSFSIVWLGWAGTGVNYVRVYEDAAEPLLVPVDTVTPPPIWPNEDNINPSNSASGIQVPLPTNIDYRVEYNPETGLYEVVQTVGNRIDFRPRTTMTLDEFLDWQLNSNVTEYWKEIKEEEDAATREFAPVIKVGGEGFENIFGSNEIEIRPQGSAELTFGANISKTDNPRIPERQRRISTFNFDQKIQLNVVGNIGTKMKLNVNYNTESTFDFENQMKLEYTGDEDQIIRKIELGNVSLPLRGSLIQGSSSLFGAKVETQWGRLKNTTVFSQQKGERKEITIQGGAQTQQFEITGDNYEANRHYFLSGWFRDQYDNAMASLPVVNSGVNITRIEVWVVNQQANTQDVRNLVAFSDLGENGSYMSTDYNIGGLINPAAPANPDNENNTLYDIMVNNQDVLNFSGANVAITNLGLGMEQGVHYERVGNARKLNPSEFSFNSRLGFVSLRQSLNNAEVLAVAYEYTLNGQTYQVGTLSQDGIVAPQALMLKMLKSSITLVRLANGDPAPLWDNMMKNVYNLGAFGVSPENFRLDVWYNNPATGVDMNFIPRGPLDGRLLLQVLNLDRIDQQQMPYPDGFFDFVPNAATTGGLIDAQTGRIFFPVIEPFGSHLREVIEEELGSSPEAIQLISQVVFQPLYDSTKTAAQIQFPQLNRFEIRGQYQSASGSEISLNALNIPQGSVQVTSGGIQLREGQDYTVDYNLGRVRILNEGVLSSGQPINVSLESNSMFNLQFKTLLGSRFDYQFSENFTVGGTIMNLRERPLTQKVNIGDEPVNNTVIGADLNFQREAPFLTRWVDRIPFIDTKEKSTLTISAEAAKLFPGHSRAISRDGNAYVDDFEGSQSLIDLRALNQWFLASTPKLQNGLFPEASLENNLANGYNRAQLAWYIIDPLFFRQNALTPPNVDADMQSNHFMREVLEAEVFPNRELPPGTPPNIATLDLSFYPSERGQYNFELPNGEPGISAGLNPDGTLAEPQERWGGIQRALTTTDFETSNVQFIQFWLMDPFNEDSENTNGGDLYFNLGNVSEDVLFDSHLMYENGLPTTTFPDLETQTSVWGVQPSQSNFNVVNAFDNSTNSYDQQDLGLDGLNSNGERDFFSSWLSQLQGFLTADAFALYSADPASDDYANFRSSQADSAGLTTLERYKFFNNNEGNSNTATPDGYPIAATNIPNTEDINQDITLNSIESYFQYKVSLRPNDLGEINIGSNYITDSFETIKETENGEERPIRWYQFKIPIQEFESRFGNIPDFRSIRFIRMFLKDWEEPVTLRFARLELVRGEWRKYEQDLAGDQETEPNDDQPTTFNIAAVNIEENGNREPVNYTVPPGIIREQDVASANLRSLNEQSLSMQVCNLQDGDARATYRNVALDLRQYKRLRMFSHIEAAGVETELRDRDLTVFIRLGSDFDQNYYEYEIAMEVTPWNTNDDDEIWPEANNFDILLRDLQNLKAERPASQPLTSEYTRRLASNIRITVKGNPNLANVTVLMLGVRNPDKDNNPFSDNDDGKSKCAEVWVNELRMSEFDETSGWAALASVNAQLADFANVAVAGNISTPGWGTLEQRVQERQQMTKMGVDANSTIQLGKFFPEHWGVQLPMYLGFSQAVETPRFSPLQPDLELNDMANISRSVRQKSQTFTKRRSINFTNVKVSPKKDPTKAPEVKEEPKVPEGQPASPAPKQEKEDKPRFYSIDNFSVSYAYNEIFFRDINMEYRLNKQYQGGFDYNFNNKPKEIRPFAKIPVVKDSKYLRWIKDFNFYPGLKSVGFHTDMNRTYETSRVRNNTLELTGVFSDMLITTQVQKNWNWRRQYDVKYDLTKSIKLDYTANNIGLVGEPRGVINKEDREWYESYKDTVWQNIQNLGETTNFTQSASANYKLPFDKFPLVDFISGDARYGATYSWTRAPFTQDSLGNTIQNSRQLQLNGQANFETLYNKVPRLKEINQGKKKDNKPKAGAKDNPDNKDGFGKDLEDKDKDKKEKVNPLDLGLRFLMMVRNVSGTYSRNEGILLPGYNRRSRFVGMDENFEGPGVGFILGEQNTNLWGDPNGRNIAQEAAENGWLVQAPFLNNQYSETYTETWNVKANLEPIKYLRVEITANRQEGRNLQSFFRYSEEALDFEFQSPMETGNFSASINTWATAFINDDETSYSSEVFDNFLAYRLEASELLNRQTYNVDAPQPNGYYEGWGPTSQNVVIPAFIAAYSGRRVSEIELDPMATRAQPNWKVTYDGLTKIPSIKKYFKQFNLSHQYRSTVTASYVTNLNFEQNAQGLPTALDASEFPNYIPQQQIQTVTITEQLSPLIGFDMTIKTKKTNDPQVKVEYKRDRTVALGMSNLQITETKSNSLVLGIGYKITEVPNPIGRKKGSKLPIQLLKNTSINLRADLTIRDNSTLIRRIEEGQNQITAGQRLFSIKTSADMAVSDKLTVRLFYDQQLNRPKISTSFPTSNISTGLALRFTLN
jgi:hypothetical protein